MHLRKPIKAALCSSAAVMLMMGLAGCYTMLSHPQVANEELVAEHDTEMTGTTCTTCHNNEYDHNRMSSHGWGFGSWGSRNYPHNYYGYYGSYRGWQRYYYDPWWWGWNYDPYRYNNPGGGYGSSGGSAVGSPDRPDSRRGMQYLPPQPSPQYTPPPVYTGSSGQSGGSSQGGSSGQSGGSTDSGSSNDDGRDGRRGGR